VLQNCLDHLRATLQHRGLQDVLVGFGCWIAFPFALQHLREVVVLHSLLQFYVSRLAQLLKAPVRNADLPEKSSDTLHAYKI